MRRLAATFLAIATIWLSACSDSEPTHPDLGDGPPALWEIADAEGKVQGWAFGTIHALPDGVRWRTASFDQTVDQADALVVEVANLADDEATSAIFGALSKSPGQPALMSRIDPASRNALAHTLHSAGLEEADFSDTETWAAALTLAQVGRVGDPRNGADRALEAAFNDRRIVELEGAKRQLSIFDSLPEAEQADLLEAVLFELGERDEAPHAMARHWLTGDLDALFKHGDRGILGDPELRRALLVQRNFAWVEQIESLLASSQRPLIAVGAAHLPGEDGLLALLTERGYTVQRLQ